MTPFEQPLTSSICSAREQILDAAEALLTQDGAASITIAAVARSAAVSQQHVRTLFGNKERLVNAMFARWETLHPSTIIPVNMPAYPMHSVTSAAQVRARDFYMDRRLKEATILPSAASQRSKPSARRIPQARDLRAGTAKERRTRIVTLAAEGALRLRDDANLQISPELWAEIFADLEKLLNDADALQT